MAPFQRRTLAVIFLGLFGGLWGPHAVLAQKFFPDDPIEVLPRPLEVGDLNNRNTNQVYDFLNNSFRPYMRPASSAGEVNTLSEVPDSAWFTNRHGKTRMTRDELQGGPGSNNAPLPPFTVIGGKNEGIAPGFRIRDAMKRTYFVKADPLDSPEMATAADVIVSKFLYAAGYNTPENYIVLAKLSDFQIDPSATISSQFQPEEKMRWGDFEDLVNRIPHLPGGYFRLMASLAVEGKPVGPFRFEGTRTDDPNDIVPHQNRRDLRGLYLFACWLNHTDVKSNNTLDAIVEENGTRYVRHYLIDFGASLGSDTNLPKDPRLGFRYMFPRAGAVGKRIVRFGVVADPWERIRFPKDPAVGNLSAEFDPEHWTSNYPNPAFLSRQLADEIWAAKIIAAFTDDDIAAIVETGKFTNPKAAAYVTETLIQRRNKIATTYFARVLPLDRFRIEDGELHFDDLGREYGVRPDAEYNVRWFQLDNRTGEQTPLSGSRSFRIPAGTGSGGAYLVALIDLPQEPGPKVVVTLRFSRQGIRVVGIERTAA